ncbi:Protein of uncharacterised function (DUF2388) [Pseudomonas fluorescens]|uniref:Protein of uncharacterized function (DUF2388) n=1 Tax=Pseudomonas fluorescens TaxID=294 RepID=A0A379IFF7_PSEFL|nr:DUF2388 domain-containing protein [Pseudomonas fluorescens]AIG01633.1 hypothetical protein HZ99_05420 [Pseudomonas fluorescens]SUD31539.1 Protein of uncharacterised function (DUF2388) [Pseudomonas fluorescens]
MDLWKVFALCLLTSISPHTLAGEPEKPGDRAMYWTTVGPTLFSTIATELTTHPGNFFAPAKSDALAFIGSEGQIRGAQFEQAVRYYHGAYRPPFMSDGQLALAIATAY